MQDVQAAAVGLLSACVHACCMPPLVVIMLQADAAACGMLHVDPGEAGSTFSVSTISTSECIQQQALVASGGQHSCARCPIISAETTYDVLFVAEAGGAASGTKHIMVSGHPR